MFQRLYELNYHLKMLFLHTHSTISHIFSSLNINFLPGIRYVLTRSTHSTASSIHICRAIFFLCTLCGGDVYLQDDVLFSCSLELREFQSLLKAAYTAKELDAQIAEKEAHKHEERSRDIEAARVMAEKEERDGREEQRQDLNRYNARRTCDEYLRRQMAVRETFT